MITERLSFRCALALVAFVIAGCGADHTYPPLLDQVQACGERGVQQIVKYGQDEPTDYWNVVICKDGQVFKADQ